MRESEEEEATTKEIALLLRDFALTFFPFG